MTASDLSGRRRSWLYFVLIVILVGCLWVGWRDFDPWIPQDQFRDSIRWAIRSVIQILVQYVVPGTILVFLAKELLTARRRRKDDSER